MANLLDFGLAKPIEVMTAGTFTQAGITSGSPLYTSRQQTSGDQGFR